MVITGKWNEEKLENFGFQSICTNMGYLLKGDDEEL